VQRLWSRPRGLSIQEEGFRESSSVRIPELVALHAGQPGSAAALII